MSAKVFVVSGPAGVGKGTAIKILLSMREDCELSVSATTRMPRPGEIDGADYHFITRDDFAELIKRQGVAEYTEYNGNYYGTLKENIRDAVSNNRNVILEIETDGAFQIRKNMPGSVLIFLMPPSFEELEKRLRGRNTETEEQILGRLATARNEIPLAEEYDYVLLSSTPGKTAADISNIITKETKMGEINL